MDPYLYGTTNERTVRLYHSGVLIFKFYLNLEALNDLCVACIFAVTQQEEAAIRIFYVCDGKVLFRSMFSRMKAWFVPVLKQVPDDVNTVVAKYCAGNLWSLVDVTPPSYMWKRSQN